MSMQGRTAVVTGATRGIGRGVAIALGEQGAHVIITGRTRVGARSLRATALAVKAAGGTCEPFFVDHADDRQVAAWFTALHASLVRHARTLDLFVNNAFAAVPLLMRRAGLPVWSLPPSSSPPAPARGAAPYSSDEYQSFDNDESGPIAQFDSDSDSASTSASTPASASASASASDSDSEEEDTPAYNGSRSAGFSAHDKETPHTQARISQLSQNSNNNNNCYYEDEDDDDDDDDDVDDDNHNHDKDKADRQKLRHRDAARAQVNASDQMRPDIDLDFDLELDLDFGAYWDTVNNVGLRNNFVCAARAIRLMVALGGPSPAQARGVVVNISSWAGLVSLFDAAYSVGKAGVDRLSAELARESPPGVFVLSLCPGVVGTEALLARAQRARRVAQHHPHPHPHLRTHARPHPHFPDRLASYNPTAANRRGNLHGAPAKRRKASEPRARGEDGGDACVAALPLWNMETPLFVGRVLVAIAGDPNFLAAARGRVVVAAEAADHFCIDDENGFRPLSSRALRLALLKAAPRLIHNPLRFLVPRSLLLPWWLMRAKFAAVQYWR